MLLVCPTCAASYQIKDGKIGPGGRTVRCKKCATVWFALPNTDEPPPAPVAEPVAPPAAPPEAPGLGTSPGEETGWADEPATTPPTGAASQEFAAPPAPDDPGPTDGEAAADSPAGTPPVLDHVAARAGKGGRKPKAGQKQRRSFPFRPPSLAGIGKALPYMAFTLCLALVGAVAAREALARAMPGTARLFAAIGLPVARTQVTIAHVRSEMTRLDRADVLIVEGELTNAGSRTVSVPPVQIVVRDAAGADIYTWTADVLKPSLGAGESSPFRARLASPPANGRSIAVRFGQASADSQEAAAPKKS